VQKYIAQRILLTIPTLIMVTILTFVGLRVLLPASVVDLIIGEYGRNDPELKKALEKQSTPNGSASLGSWAVTAGSCRATWASRSTAVAPWSPS
jgi:ABC-type dipeptide/oligopeptide/nickel transport system permease component